VIGAGVVGLAAGAKLSNYGSTLLIERNGRYGAETSSRNSEVIHAGLYYPPQSWKTKLCIRGRELLYDLCPRVGIPFHKVGKWIFATDYCDDRWPQLQSSTAEGRLYEEKYLHTLASKCNTLNIPHRWVPKSEIILSEPQLRASLAIESPETGIIDSHSLMDYLAAGLEKRGGLLALQTSITFCEKISNGYKVRLSTGPSLDDEMWVEAKAIVNAAGLAADSVSSILMGDDSPYRVHYAKGHYYSYSGKPLVSRLTYPVPDKHLASLGVHTVLDLSGRMRFGPDIQYMERRGDLPDYHFDDTPERKRLFYEQVQRYLPSLDIRLISADFCGIRPKIAVEGGAFQDFIIQPETQRGFPRLINLIGIESPGLTSSLAIADEIASLLQYPPSAWN
jgi:L-2-hydroxyglutarate oxidase LhgO